jgi:hypothetical protein
MVLEFYVLGERVIGCVRAGGGGDTKHFISFEGRRLLQIMLGNILVTFCIWSNFLWYQQLQATSSSKCIIFGNLLLKFLKIILFIER